MQSEIFMPVTNKTGNESMDSVIHESKEKNDVAKDYVSGDSAGSSSSHRFDKN